jgi:hypothetical protein
MFNGIDTQQYDTWVCHKMGIYPERRILVGKRIIDHQIWGQPIFRQNAYV